MTMNILQQFIDKTLSDTGLEIVDNVIAYSHTLGDVILVPYCNYYGIGFWRVIR